MIRSLVELAVAGLVNDQATTILVESDIAAPVRDLVERILPPPLSDVVKCRLCAGMWIGIGQAVVGMVGRHPPTPSSALPGARLVTLFVRALAIAAAGRLAHNLTRDYLHPYEPDA